MSEDLGGCTLEQLEWEADYFGLKELLKIIGERKRAKKEKKAEEDKKKAEQERREKEVPKMSPLECREKAAEMRKKSADAQKMVGECPLAEKKGLFQFFWCECGSCKKAHESAMNYNHLAKEYESKAADLRRRGY